MPWISLPAVTCTDANTPYPIDEDPRTVHSLFLQQHWDNTGKMFVGDTATFDPTSDPPTHMLGWIPAPVPDTTAPSLTLGEQMAPNGVSTGEIWVASDNAGDVIIVSVYIS